MIPVHEADALLARCRDPYPAEEVPLAEAADRILRAPIVADRATPALDRSRMDGIAIAFAAWDMGVRSFALGGMARAGDARCRLDDASGCVEIMTGAPCPEGADTVIPYERLRIENGAAVVEDAARVEAGQFLHRAGSDCAAGEVLVGAGARLHAAAIAAAASMGYARVTVTRKPRISLVTTGDELVGVEAAPLPHQVRASNGHALRALLEGLGPVGLDHAGDAVGALTEALERALAASDVLLVTGGVSAGKFDEVPAVLASLGVKRVFHKVAQKPGKPLWFGRGPAGQLVFGLPGNPVSALVCARRYVVPLLRAKSGETPARAPQNPSLRLADSVAPSPTLTRFLPVQRVQWAGNSAPEEAILCPVNGSGDFSRLGRSDGFVEVPAGKNALPAGEILSFFSWETRS